MSFCSAYRAVNYILVMLSVGATIIQSPECCLLFFWVLYKFRALGNKIRFYLVSLIHDYVLKKNV